MSNEKQLKAERRIRINRVLFDHCLGLNNGLPHVPFVDAVCHVCIVHTPNDAVSPLSIEIREPWFQQHCPNRETNPL